MFSRFKNFALSLGTGNTPPEPDIIFDNQTRLYSRKWKSFTIFSHDRRCIERAYKQIFEQRVYEFTASSEAPVIIDAGANIGMGTLFWKERYPNSRIIAFEPSRQVFESLTKNVERNALINVTCINKALSDEDGELEFCTEELIGGSIVLEKGLPHTYTVKTERLSKYLDQPVDLLKIDIEGAEHQVFPEIAPNLKNVKHIFLEYHSFTHKRQELASLLEILESNGFRYYIEGERRHTAPFTNDHISAMQDLQLNIWAIRR